MEQTGYALPYCEPMKQLSGGPGVDRRQMSELLYKVIQHPLDDKQCDPTRKIRNEVVQQFIA